MKSLLQAGFILFLMGLASDAYAQDRLSLERIMSAEERQRIGINKLSADERIALEQWISDWTTYVLRFAEEEATTPSRPQTYTGLGRGHWVQRTANSGALVILEDQSLWSINAAHRIYTTLWLPITNITVLEARQPVGEYRYWLVNTDNGERALAQFLGRQ